jgi:hypothetical protein
MPMVRPTLSYANVMSSVAVFVALGGTGYAVTKLPRNSVGATQLKANAVTSSKIRARAVQRSDLAPSARIGSRGPRGSAGPAGAAGAAGATGPSETIQVKPPAMGIPSAAGGTVTLATVTVTPGSWLFNAQTRIIYLGAGVSDFFDCDLRTATNELLQRGSVRVGEDASATSVATIPLQVAATFSVATSVTFSCTHPSSVPGTQTADQTTLLATRVGALASS